MPPSRGSARREGRKVQLCQHQSWLALGVLLCKGTCSAVVLVSISSATGRMGTVCQLWARGEAERQPSSESIKWALGAFLWGWWISAQPAGSPMAPIPPTPLHAGAVAAAQEPQSGWLGGALSSDAPFQSQKVLWGVCGFLPRCPCSCPQLSCSPHCPLQRQPQAGHGDAGGLSEGRSKCLLVALCPRELGLLVLLPLAAPL